MCISLRITMVRTVYYNKSLPFSSPRKKKKKRQRNLYNRKEKCLLLDWLLNIISQLQFLTASISPYWNPWARQCYAVPLKQVASFCFIQVPYEGNPSVSLRTKHRQIRIAALLKEHETLLLIYYQNFFSCWQFLVSMLSARIA